MGVNGHSGKSKTRSGFFYGYTVVLASALILVVMHGIASSFGVFFTEFQGEFHWNRAMISGATSLSFFLLGLFSTITGRITDRYGPRITMAFSAVILLVGYLLMSTIHAIWQLYLFYGIAIALGNSGGDMSVLPTVARWFVRRRGLMSSIVKAGTGTGMFVMPLVAAWLITSTSWRTAYIVLGVTALIAVLGFSRLLRRDPADMGLRPYGGDNTDVNNGGTTNTSRTTREMLRTRVFWLLSGSYFLVWYVTQSIMVHIAPHAVDTGLSVAQAAGILSVVGGASVVGRLTMGNASDRIGTRKALLVCFGVLLIAMILLQFEGQTWMLYVFALVYGFSHGGFFAIISPLLADIYGVGSHASNLGMLFFIGMTGGAVGPIITGWLFDVAQNYIVAFVILLAAATIGLVLALLIKPIKNR
jgi:MFS family permease